MLIFLRRINALCKSNWQQSIFYDIVHDCPTNAAIVLFGINASFFLHGCYVQYVHFAGEDTGSEILNERQMRGSLCSILPKLESFVKDAIVTSRPMPVSMLREQIVFNYPELALRELLMNAVCIVISIKYDL